jgi:hypothetical protein
MYFIKRGLRVLQQKPKTVNHILPSQKKSQTKASYTTRDKEKATELLARGQQRPERPETGSHPKCCFVKDSLQKNSRLSRRYFKGSRIALFPEVLSDNEEKRVEASTDLLRKPFP